VIAFCKARQIVSLAAIAKTHLTEFKLSLNLKSGNSNSLRISLSVVGRLFRWATEEAGIPQREPVSAIQTPLHTRGNSSTDR
jgi:hypothetical protein